MIVSEIGNKTIQLVALPSYSILFCPIVFDYISFLSISFCDFSTYSIPFILF